MRSLGTQTASGVGLLHTALMNFSELKTAGHWPTLLTAFLYFDASFMAWTILGALGVQIGATLGLTPEQKGLMVAVPYLSGAFIRILFGMMVDRIGAKNTGIIAQVIVILCMTVAWLAGLKQFSHTIILGLTLGVAGASFAVALPQASRWYPPNMQGLVLGITGAGNVGVVLDAIFAPRLAQLYGWNQVLGMTIIPLVLVLVAYVLFSKEAQTPVRKRTLRDYTNLLREKDAHWFCFFYTVSFGGFSGLAASLIIYFTSEFHVTAVAAGLLTAGCTLIGSLGRPIGGTFADLLGGTRALTAFFTIAGLALLIVSFANSIVLCAAGFFLASGSFGMANGAVFQLLPQRFSKDIATMTGLVGCAGGLGGFLLASSLGFSKGLTGSYFSGFFCFSLLCALALISITLVKLRWRSTWGALAAARI